MYSLALSDFGAKGVKAKTCPPGQMPVRKKGKWKCVVGTTPCAAGESLRRWKAKGKWKQACVPSAVTDEQSLSPDQLQTLMTQTPQMPPEEAAAQDGLPIWAWGVIGGGAALAVLGGAFVVIKKRKKAKAAAMLGMIRRHGVWR